MIDVVASPNVQQQQDDECTSLLESGPTPIRRTTALPTRQLAALCFIRLADPIAFTQIFPYVNDMMVNFGLATSQADVGFYSGLVESIFALSQLMSICQWARLSDSIGRRPVIFAGTIGMALTTIQFGLSKSLAGVLIARFLAGLFSGNVAVMHSVLGELTDATNQALAFPIYGLCWPIGVIIGIAFSSTSSPLIGGTFSNPADKWPFLFQDQIFRVFPYLLPCIVTAVITLASVTAGWFYLDETRPSKHIWSEKEYSISYGAIEHRDRFPGEIQDDVPPTFRQLLSIPIMRSLCISGCALSFVGTAFDVVFVLFCYSPIRMGGLAYSISEIGYALAIAGLSSAFIQMIIMPSLLRKFPTAQLYAFCMRLWPLTFIFLPALNILATHGLDGSAEVVQDGRIRALLWIGIGITLIISRVGCLAYSLNMILVKENSPGPLALGSANGLAQFAQCLARAISPAFVSCLFAYSVNCCIMGGHFWVVVMTALSVLSCMSITTIPSSTSHGTQEYQFAGGH